MARLATLATLLVTGFVVACVRAQPPEAMTVVRLRDNLFVIAGDGGNTAVFVRPEGVVLVDTKVANRGQRILDLVRTLTDKPITHIINTHSHFDHIGSNAFFPAAVEVVAHESAAGQMVNREEFAEPSAQHGLPDRMFKDRLSLFAGSDAIELHHFGAAHTNGDAFVVFRALRVMHAGDTFPGPNPVRRDGGSAEAYPATMSRAVAILSGVDVVIPGHGAVATWQDFVDNVNAMNKR